MVRETISMQVNKEVYPQFSREQSGDPHPSREQSGALPVYKRAKMKTPNYNKNKAKQTNKTPERKLQPLGGQMRVSPGLKSTTGCTPVVVVAFVVFEAEGTLFVLLSARLLTFHPPKNRVVFYLNPLEGLWFLIYPTKSWGPTLCPLDN